MPALEVAEVDVTDVNLIFLSGDDQWVPAPSVCTMANGGVS